MKTVVEVFVAESLFAVKSQSVAVCNMSLSGAAFMQTAQFMSLCLHLSAGLSVNPHLNKEDTCLW